MVVLFLLFPVTGFPTIISSLSVFIRAFPAFVLFVDSFRFNPKQSLAVGMYL